MEFEEKIDAGFAEELMKQAQDELVLIGQMKGTGETPCARAGTRARFATCHKMVCSVMCGQPTSNLSTYCSLLKQYTLRFVPNSEAWSQRRHFVATAHS